MKTMKRAGWLWLLVAVTCGCNAKQLEVHYVQIEACQTWSDQSDNPDTAFQNPLVVFRLVSVKNNSAKGTPNINFDLQKVFFNSGGVHHFPELDTSIPSFFDIGQMLVPGQSIQFPQSGIPGLFAIQPFDTTPNVQGQEYFLLYDSASDESVFMVRDPSPLTYQPFCGQTALSALQ
jgi:hypothetical protein